MAKIAKHTLAPSVSEPISAQDTEVRREIQSPVSESNCPWLSTHGSFPNKSFLAQVKISQLPAAMAFGKILCFLFLITTKAMGLQTSRSTEEKCGCRVGETEVNNKKAQRLVLGPE